MNITLLGATGTVGRHVVSQALGRGHAVTALVRSAPKLLGEHGPSRELLRIVEGDALDPAAVARAVSGADAVIVALGAGRKGRVRAEGTQNAIAAMQAYGVRRLLVQSTLGAGDSWEALTWFWKWVMFKGLLRPAFADHAEQERLTRESGLDWTIVRPGAFTDGPPTGRYRHGFAPDAEALRLKVSRADVAAFLLDQVTDRTYVHQCPGLSY